MKETKFISAACIALLLIAHGPAAASQDAGSVQADAADGGSAESTGQEQEATPSTAVSVSASVQQGQPAIGRQFEVRFDFTYPEGTRVYFPDAPETKPFVLVGTSSPEKTVLGRGNSESHSLKLLAVRAGDLKLKPFEVPVVLPDGQAAVVSTPEVTIAISSTIGNDEALELAGPGDTAPVIVRNDPLIWGLGILLASGLAALAAVSAYRRYRAWVEARRPPPPPVPAHERAYSRLREVEQACLVERRMYKELSLILSEIVREFMGSRIGFSGADSTTWETIDFVRSRRPDQDIGSLDINELDDFLNLCDLIKFAKFEPSVNDATSLLRRARGVVDSVMMTRTIAASPDSVATDAGPNTAVPDPAVEERPAGTDGEGKNEI